MFSLVSIEIVFLKTKKINQTSEKQGDVLQLGDVVLSVTTLFAKQRQVLQVFSAGVSRVQLGELSEDHPPGPDLLQGVLDTRDGLPAGEETYRSDQTLMITGLISTLHR